MIINEVRIGDFRRNSMGWHKKGQRGRRKEVRMQGKENGKDA
jgi:hypothetical protein